MDDYFLALVRGDKRGVWPALARGGLWALSVPYAWATGLRNWLYDRGWKKTERVSVPVVCVGNLTVGGTGKTPCVEYVARFYREHERRVAILSRGYGSAAGRNDEALVLEENLPDVPHLQGADRTALARTAVEELESEILVLDDGFQHRRLARDLDLVLVDATNPWGYGRQLPRGLLRESPRGLRRASLALLTRCDQVDEPTLTKLRTRMGQLAPGLPLVETTHQPAAWINSAEQRQPREFLTGRPVAGFCGIGNPEGFRRTLVALGLNVLAWRTFPDHHAYSRGDIDELRVWAKQLPAEAALVTTQKDLVKIRLETLADRDLWALRIELAVRAGKEILEEKLRGVLRLTDN